MDPNNQINTETQTPKQDLPKYKRLQQIFLDFLKMSTASSARQAYKNFAFCWHNVEQRYEKKMNLYKFRDLVHLRKNNQKTNVRYFFYEYHALFVSETGALEIRRKDREDDTLDAHLNSNLTSALERMSLNFSRPDSKGNDVWGDELKEVIFQ